MYCTHKGGETQSYTQCLEAWEKSHLDNKYSVFCEAADGADRLYILCVFIGSTFWQIVLGPHWQCCCFYLVELENKCHSAKRIKIPSVLFTFCVMTTKSNIAECYVSRTPVWQRSLCAKNHIFISYTVERRQLTNHVHVLSAFQKQRPSI